MIVCQIVDGELIPVDGQIVYCDRKSTLVNESAGTVIICTRSSSLVRTLDLMRYLFAVVGLHAADHNRVTKVRGGMVLAGSFNEVGLGNPNRTLGSGSARSLRPNCLLMRTGLCSVVL